MTKWGLSCMCLVLSSVELLAFPFSRSKAVSCGSGSLGLGGGEVIVVVPCGLAPCDTVTYWMLAGRY